MTLAELEDSVEPVRDALREYSKRRRKYRDIYGKPVNDPELQDQLFEEHRLALMRLSYEKYREQEGYLAGVASVLFLSKIGVDLTGEFTASLVLTIVRLQFQPKYGNVNG
jgi:hypothetical protein